MIRDQGEIAIAIELKEEGQDPVIIGHSNPETQIKTSLDYRDAFLAAADMHEAPIIYHQGRKDKRRLKGRLRKNPRVILKQAVTKQLDVYQPFSEAILAQRVQGIKDKMANDEIFRKEVELLTQYREEIECEKISVLITERVKDPETHAVYTKKKRVIEKVKPQYRELPGIFRIERNIIGDPMDDLPELSKNPGNFEPTGRYTVERKTIIDKQHDPNFLWPEEKKLRDKLMMKQNQAFAWCDEEKGRFDTNMFPPIKMPVVEHELWIEKNMPIPPGIFDEVCKIIKQKINNGTYEPSNSSYRSRWFCVIKKDGKSLRIVHSLEPLNLVTIAHSGVPPGTDAIADQFAGRSCGSTFDLYVGYDERLLDETSRDYTTFQTPFGALRLTTLPMGWTNSVPIFHDDVTFILQDEVPHVTIPYIDNIPVKGPLTRYEQYDQEGNIIEYETLDENPGI